MIALTVQALDIDAGNEVTDELGTGNTIDNYKNNKMYQY